MDVLPLTKIYIFVAHWSLDRSKGVDSENNNIYPFRDQEVGKNQS